MFNIDFADDWIRTAELLEIESDCSTNWASHNHCPILVLLIIFVAYLVQIR